MTDLETYGSYGARPPAPEHSAGWTDFERSMGRAFMCLPGTRPETFLESEGCKWPIHTQPGNPLKQPYEGLCCGQRREWKGDRQLPWCAHHQRMAYSR